LGEAQKRRADIDDLQRPDQEGEEKDQEQEVALQSAGARHKRRLEEISLELECGARQVVTTEVTLLAYQCTEWGLYVPVPEQEPVPVPLVKRHQRLADSWSLGPAPSFASHVLLFPSCIVFSSDPEASPPRHMQRDLCGQDALISPGPAVGALEVSEHPVLLLVANGGLTCRDMVSRKEWTSLWTLDKVAVRAYSSAGSELVTVALPGGSGVVVARLYCFRPERGLLWATSWALSDLDFKAGAKPAVALSPCSGFLAVACAPCLNLFKLVKGRAVLQRARDLEQTDFLGLFFRAQHLVLVQDATVTYLSLQLEPVFEFKFAVPEPVVSVSCRDELWAVLAGGDAFLCQDKFYVQ
jgi:hypothetical protein